MQMYWGIQHPVFMRRKRLDKLPGYSTILNAKEKQAAAKLTFVFRAFITSKRPMKSDRERGKRGFASKA